MKYNCRYPHKLTIESYCDQIVEDYEGRYHLNKKGMEVLVWYILVEIKQIIEEPKNELKKAIEYLLKISNLSKDEFTALSSNVVEPESSYSKLYYAEHEPIIMIELISNNMQFQFPDNEQEQYASFLQEVTLKCIKEIVEVNKLKTCCKKSVKFNQEVAICTGAQRQTEVPVVQYELQPLFKSHRRRNKQSGALNEVEENVVSVHCKREGNVAKKRRVEKV